jgi:hypothetical protein
MTPPDSQVRGAEQRSAGSTQDHDVATHVAMIRLMWPNHDRHGGCVPNPDHHD